MWRHLCCAAEAKAKKRRKKAAPAPPPAPLLSNPLDDSHSRHAKALLEDEDEGANSDVEDGNELPGAGGAGGAVDSQPPGQAAASQPGGVGGLSGHAAEVQVGAMLKADCKL